MKVITDNREGWSKQIECARDCKSVLEIEETDIKFGQFGAMGEYDWMYYVTCPLCDSNIFLKDLPPHIKAAIRKRLKK